MKAKKITDNEIRTLLVSSLPTRPTAPRSFGGAGYTSEDMKAAFDKLPLYIVERINRLIDDIFELGSDSLAGAIPTGIKDGHTLADTFSDLVSGAALSYITDGAEPLSVRLDRIEDNLGRVMESVGINGREASSK